MNFFTDEEKENEIHNRFIRFHKRGEWFFYHQTILDYFYGQPDYFLNHVVEIIPLSFKKRNVKKQEKESCLKRKMFLSSQIF